MFNPPTTEVVKEILSVMFKPKISSNERFLQYRTVLAAATVANYRTPSFKLARANYATCTII